MPRVKLTSAQRERALLRVRAGEPVTAVARDCGLHHSTLLYHLGGGKARHYAGRPWLASLAAARRHLSHGEHARAAAALRQAADLIDPVLSATPDNTPGDDAIAT